MQISTVASQRPYFVEIQAYLMSQHCRRSKVHALSDFSVTAEVEGSVEDSLDLANRLTSCETQMSKN